nr:hypothetical protein [Tanacetum cinerariifolium]
MVNRYEEETPNRYQEMKLAEVIEGGQDNESYASKFATSMLDDDDDVDDSDNRLELGSQKENLKVIHDDDVNDDEKKDEKNDDVAMLELMIWVVWRIRLRRCRQQFPQHIYPLG